MNRFSKSFIKFAMLSLLSVMPLAAQIDNGLDFTTSFPFYVGDTKLPAGNYRVFQPDMDVELLQIQSIDGLQSAFVGFAPTQSARAHGHSAVTFEKYGDRDYLNRVWIEGQEYGIKTDPGRVESQAAAHATSSPHATAAGGQ